TIAQLERLANRIANALEARGIGPGSRVATMLGNSIEHMGLFIALTMRGACQIPINVHLRGEGLAYILRSCECDCLIAEAELAGALAPIFAEVPIPSVVWRGGAARGESDFAALVGHQDASAHAVAADPDAVVYICYTSGT